MRWQFVAGDYLLKPRPLDPASDPEAVPPLAPFRSQLKPLLLLTSIFGFNTKMGFTQSQTNSLVALSRIPGIAMVFVGGWLTDRLGPRRSMQWIYAFMGTFTILLGVCSPTWIVPVVFLQSMAAVCFPPAAVVAISLIGPPKSRNFTLSLTVPLAFLVGAGVIPSAIGFMGDRDAFALGFALVGILVLAGAVLPRFLKLEAA